MKYLLFVLILIFTLSISSYAQVGIGQVPKNGSILDLTNSNNKYLILPVPTTDPASVMTDSAAVFYYRGNIYLKTATGIKIFTPWEWNGTSTGPVSSPAGSSVGIGVVPTVTNYKLHVADAGEVESALAGNASIIVGDPASGHLLMDNNEIMAKVNPNTAGVLKLQEESGTVEIRMDTLTTDKTVLKANGSIDAAGSGSIKENGFDLVPSGTVVMWYGSYNAGGYPLMAGVANTNWYICDGNMGTPDLRDRFIVGAGTSYSLGNTGGVDSLALTVAEIPAHNHPASSSVNGNHSHKTGGIPYVGEGYVAAYNGSNEVFDWDYTHDVISSDNGDHSHTIDVSNTGGGSYHENRPPFFALVFIMKL